MKQNDDKLYTIGYMQVIDNNDVIDYKTQTKSLKWNYTKSPSSVARCPICNGTGNVPGGFYNSTGGTFISNVSIEVCRSCSGKGYIIY